MTDESRAEKFLELFNKGKEFTEELLRENQRLRYRVAALETEGMGHEEVTRLRDQLQQLSEENRRISERFHEVEEENKDFASRYIEVEEQNNNLANLYVASYQLHSTLDFREVIQIVQEIVINLIGALFLGPPVGPFEVIDELVDEAQKRTPVIVVDMHAEATSEKVALAKWLDGKVTAVLGTHTHIQTNDARVQPGGTAAITDAGMTLSLIHI